MSYFTKSLIVHVFVFSLIAVFYNTEILEKKKRIAIHTSTVKLAPVLAVADVSDVPPSLEVPPISAPSEAPPEPLPPPPPAPIPIVAPTPPPPAKKPEPKQQIAKIEPKKEEKKKKEEPKKEIVKAAPPPPSLDSKKADLLKEARDSLAKMGSSTNKTVPSSPRSSLSSLKAEGMNFSVKGEENDLYSLELIKRLKLHLRLPENGEVLVDLTLTRGGKVAGLKIIHAKSSSNKHYVETALPQMAFPEFGTSYPHKEEKLFTLSLHNEIF